MEHVLGPQERIAQYPNVKKLLGDTVLRILL